MVKVIVFFNEIKNRIEKFIFSILYSNQKKNIKQITSYHGMGNSQSIIIKSLFCTFL